MGGKPAGKQSHGLLRHDLAAGKLGRRPQGFREADQRALVLEPGGAGGGKRLDQKQVSQGGIRREKLESGGEAGGGTAIPAACAGRGGLDSRNEPLHSVS